MARLLVTCVKCGRLFDATSYGYAYDQQAGTYICWRCHQDMVSDAIRRKLFGGQFDRQLDNQTNQNKIIEVKRKEYKFGQPTALFIIALILSAYFLYIAFHLAGRGSSDWLFDFLLAFVIFDGPFWCWAFIPFAYARKRDKRKKEEELREAEAARAYRIEQENRIKVCSACGATSRGFVCEYCGTELK